MEYKYRVRVHYYFKQGLEEQGIKFLENELIKRGTELGCHYIELWQNDRDPSSIEGIAVWRELRDAQAFQSKWEKKEQELIHQFCTKAPTREFCKIRSSFIEKSRKAA